MNATPAVTWLDSPTVLTTAVQRVTAVKSLGLDIAIDFHGRLHKPMAKQLATLLQPLQPLFIEEPLLSEHVSGITQLSHLTSTPIALGERLHSRWDLKPFLEAGNIDICQPDVCHVGGISELKRMAAMCEAYDVAIAPHCPLGSIALAACLQIAACTSNHVIQEMSQGIHYNTDVVGGVDIGTYVRNPEVFDVREGGFLDVPGGVGLGIEVDEEVVKRLSVGCKAWRSGEFYHQDGGVAEW